MKHLIPIALILIAFTAKGQRMPGETSYGAKLFFLGSSPSGKSLNSSGAKLNSTRKLGFSLSGYAKYEINEFYRFQPEIMISSTMSQHLIYTTTNTFDASLSGSGSVVTDNELLVTYTNVAIPLYFKRVFEFTLVKKGHYKATQTLGIMAGPRIDMNLFPTKTSLIRETTDLYGQRSVEVIRTEYSPGRDVVRGLGAGISVGVDWEMSNRLVMHLQYYRGLTSILKKESGFKSFNNQLELGIGYCFW